MVVGSSSNWLAGDGDKVNAVAVALAVWEIVTKVRSIHRHGLAVGKNAHVFPIDFIVAEGGPVSHITRWAREGEVKSNSPAV